VSSIVDIAPSPRYLRSTEAIIRLANKSVRGIGAMAYGGLEDNLIATSWLTQTTQQIQVLDYELHATLRIIAAGEKLDLAHNRAFIAATSKRAQPMARVVRHVMGTQ
jgi:hypothetical protein